MVWKNEFKLVSLSLQTNTLYTSHRNKSVRYKGYLSRVLCGMILNSFEPHVLIYVCYYFFCNLLVLTRFICPSVVCEVTFAADTNEGGHYFMYFSSCDVLATIKPQKGFSLLDFRFLDGLLFQKNRRITIKKDLAPPTPPRWK